MATKTDIVTEDYKEKYGFSDPVDSYAVKGVKGLNERVVQEISRLHDEPAWMEQIRMKALKHFLERKASGVGSGACQHRLPRLLLLCQPNEQGREVLGSAPRLHQTYL